MMRMRTAKRTVALAAALAVLAACGTLSVQDEKQMGRDYTRAMRQEFQMVRDPVTLRYIRELGEALVAAAEPSPFEFRFYVVESDDLQASAGPAGIIFVHTGLILGAKDTSELAAVLAHEIGHVTARHYAEAYRRHRNTGVLAQVAAAVINASVGARGPGEVVAGGAAQAFLTTHTRDAEREADRLAVETLIRAGFDPEGLPRIFETLRREYGGGFRMPQFLRTHPTDEERIETARAMIAERQPLPDDIRRTDGGRLEIIQERLNLILGTDIEDYLDDEPEDEEYEGEDEEDGEELEREVEIDPDAEP